MNGSLKCVTRTITLLLFALTITPFLSLTATAAETGLSLEKIVGRLKARHKAVLAMKAAGHIGETADGKLAATNEKHLKVKATRNLLDAENKDRSMLFALIANEEKTEVKVVALRYAIRKFKLARTGDMLKGKDGVWRAKEQ